jgi:hypothetical protein
MSKKSAQAQTYDNNISIDLKHSQLLEQYNTIETEIIPQLTEEKATIKSSLSGLKKKNITKYLEAKDRLVEIRDELRKLKTSKKQYLLNNSKYIFNYFEQKKQISEDANTKNQNTNALNQFFKVSPSIISSVGLALPHISSHTRTAYRQYWNNVNNDAYKIQDYIISMDICQICNKGELIPQDEEGIMICNNNNCGHFITYIVDSSKPTNKEPPNEVSYTAYIRLNHFKEILSQFQAKETTKIPDEVIDAIKARIKKERITDMKLINYDKMREILRKLGLNKYFEHIQYINSLFGIKPPIMNEELHETLCILFIEIQQPWAMHCPPSRTNFFNYTYTLYQLCVLLDQTQYLPFIPMMKDREKQLEQDMIWKKVCNELDWAYFPTV